MILFGDMELVEDIHEEDVEVWLEDDEVREEAAQQGVRFAEEELMDAEMAA